MLEYRNILTRDRTKLSVGLPAYADILCSPLFLPSLPTRRLRLFFLFHPSLKATFYVSSNRKSHLCQITVDARVPLEFLLAIPLSFAYSIRVASFSRSSFLQPLRRFRFDKLQYVERSALYVKFSANITKEFPLQRFSVAWNYVTSGPYLAATIRAKGYAKKFAWKSSSASTGSRLGYVVLPGERPTSKKIGQPFFILRLAI